MTVKSEPASTPQRGETVVETTLPNPYESLLATAILFLSTVEQQSKPYPLQCKDAHEQLSELSKLGLANTVNASRLRLLAGHYETYQKAVKTIGFMCEVWRVFGNNTIVIRPNHFHQVLKRHNLVCGRLKYFKGELPPKALEEYISADAKVRLYRYPRSRYASFEVPKNLPWVTQMDCGGLALEESCAIAAPIECFEVAPKEELDPFIFSYSELGYILIHAKWGAEAEDATIKRYEQLRDAIIGKGGAL